MFSAIGAVLKPLMLFNGVQGLTIKFNCEARALEITYTQAGKAGSTVMPFSDIEAQVNDLSSARAETQPKPPPNVL